MDLLTLKTYEAIQNMPLLSKVQNANPCYTLISEWNSMSKKFLFEDVTRKTHVIISKYPYF